MVFKRPPTANSMNNRKQTNNRTQTGTQWERPQFQEVRTHSHTETWDELTQLTRTHTSGPHSQNWLATHSRILGKNPNTWHSQNWHALKKTGKHPKTWLGTQKIGTNSQRLASTQRLGTDTIGTHSQRLARTHKIDSPRTHEDLESTQRLGTHTIGTN